jgi:DNA (cytosine-5)-methyltransferase 1
VRGVLLNWGSLILMKNNVFAQLGLNDIAFREIENEFYNSRKRGVFLKKRKLFTLIDTFAGAGGMTLGFSRRFGHLFKPVWANDFDKASVDTYNANFGKHCILGDIIDVLENPSIKIPLADVVIGGPPCQGFSLLNKTREGDPRKQLWIPYFEIVKRANAKIFIMENVPQLLGSKEYDEIVSTAKSLGYMVQSAILNSADYGVPQTRKRAIILGSMIDTPYLFFPPRKTNINYSKLNQKSLSRQPGENGYLPNPRRWNTVRDAISDLPNPIGTDIRDEPPPLDIHFGRTPTAMSKARYRAISKEGMNRFDLQRIAPELTPDCWIRKKTGGTDLLGRLWWDKPAFTIRTEFFKPEKGRYLHPKAHRPITHREAARLQSFPDDFIFKGNKIEIARQIGNAVPPILAARIADTVALILAYK